MGMAAGQARLLSITSRMSDNELRAQIINNNKMRLATESSQASEAYVAALNEAQLMFTNYDAENNTTYQNLTFNALTTFNPYNNQYALINSSGQVLLSEKDAENYRASHGDLNTFLSMYGLEKTTTYFDDLEKYATNDGKVKIPYTDAEGNIVLDDLHHCGFTASDLQAAYLGSDEELKFSTNMKIKPNGYMATANSSTNYDYEKYMSLYLDTEADYLSSIGPQITESFNAIKINDINDEKSFSDLETDAAKLTVNNVGFFRENLTSFLTTLKNSNKLSDYGKNEIDNIIKKEISNKLAKEIIDTYNKDDYESKKLDNTLTIHLSKEDDNGSWNETASTATLEYGIYEKGTGNTTPIAYVGTDNKIYLCSYSYKKNDKGEYVVDDKGKYVVYNFYFEPSGYEYTKENTSSDYIFIHKYGDATDNDLQNNAKAILYEIKSSYKDWWNKDGNEFTTNNPTYTYYKDAANELGKVIYGKQFKIGETGYPDIDKLGDIDELYNTIGKDVTDGTDGTDGKYKDFTKDFYQVYIKLILDKVFDTYGEPKYTWIDTSNPNDSYNTNGEAKAAWYENLFNRIKSGGFQVLQDGLASSSEWIQFAFESGIVTMEQVDTLKTWQPLIYSNCSDITSQTNDAMIAKAEAEYRNAMNKIENKDKRYDLELKNIDTEHNSLMAEYESIKAAIDKNIDRTFKLYT